MARSIRLTSASAPLTREIAALDEYGAVRRISIPAERALTVFVDNRELVTLMTLGAAPELLVLGYLRNQRLDRIDRRHRIDHRRLGRSGGCREDARRHRALRREDRQARRHDRCGQGTVFGELMTDLDSWVLPPPTNRFPDQPSDPYGLLDAIRRQESTYKSAGSVAWHARCSSAELLTFVEDVGRHNAIDTIAGWMWLTTLRAATRVLHDRPD